MANKTYECKLCNKTYTKKYQLDVHIDTHVALQEFRCKICRNAFTTSAGLARHMRKHKDIRRPYECEVCKKRFVEKIDKKRHMMQHTNEKYIMCRICEEQYDDKNELIKHIRMHTNEEPYECECCQNIFVQSDNHKCHENLMNDDNQGYKCRDCSRKFPDLVECLQHMKTHRGKELIDCKICGQVFAHTISLNYHMKNHNRGKQYKCNKCGEAFDYFNTYISHKRLHTGKKCYSCVLCPMTFLRRYVLKFHMLQHTGERPLKCNLCTRSFVRKDALRRHMRHLHFGNKKCLSKYLSIKKKSKLPKHKGIVPALSNKNTAVMQKNDSVNEKSLGRFLYNCRHSATSRKINNTGLQNEVSATVAANHSKKEKVETDRNLGFKELKEDIPLVHIEKSFDNSKTSLSEHALNDDIPDRHQSSNKQCNMQEYHYKDSCSVSCVNSEISKFVKKQSKCRICGKFFVNDIVRTYHHMRQHIGEECNQCMSCGQVFYNLSDLKSHESQHNFTV